MFLILFKTLRHRLSDALLQIYLKTPSLSMGFAAPAEKQAFAR